MDPDESDQIATCKDKDAQIQVKGPCGERYCWVGGSGTLVTFMFLFKWPPSWTKIPLKRTLLSSDWIGQGKCGACPRVIILMSVPSPRRLYAHVALSISPREQAQLNINFQLKNHYLTQYQEEKNGEISKIFDIWTLQSPPTLQQTKSSQG